MGDAKRWQIVVIVVALVSAAVAFGYNWLAGSSTVRLADEVLMVDVTTGELFSFSVGGGRAVMVPETNPSTGRRTLLPVDRQDNGWFIVRRSLSALDGIEDEPAAVVDRQSGEVRVARETPTRVR